MADDDENKQTGKEKRWSTAQMFEWHERKKSVEEKSYNNNKVIVEIRKRTVKHSMEMRQLVNVRNDDCLARLRFALVRTRRWLGFFLEKIPTVHA